MIVKIFRCGTGLGSGPINYLFDENKHEKYKPELVQGIPLLTKTIIDSISNKHKYVSGVIAFRDNEKLSENQQLKLINDFQKTFAPFDKQERVNFLWVRHFDKGNLELHFICPRQASTKDGRFKAFNLHPPGKANELFFQSFTRLQNLKYGFKQVDNIELTKFQVNKTFEVFTDLHEKRKDYLVSVFDKPKKILDNKKHGRTRKRKTTSSTNSQEHRESVKPILTKTRLITASSKRNHENTSFRTKDDNQSTGRHGEIQSLFNFNQYATESIHRHDKSGERASQGGREPEYRTDSRKSSKASTSTVGLSYEEEIRQLAISLNDCDTGQVASITARINMLQGQLDRTRPPAKKM